jgi:hypothetical protein
MGPKILCILVNSELKGKWILEKIRFIIEKIKVYKNCDWSIFVKLRVAY